MDPSLWLGLFRGVWVGGGGGAVGGGCVDPSLGLGLVRHRASLLPAAPMARCLRHRTVATTRGVGEGEEGKGWGGLLLGLVCADWPWVPCGPCARRLRGLCMNPRCRRPRCGLEFCLSITREVL